MNPRSSPAARGLVYDVLRADRGNCFDCNGTGHRRNIVKHDVSCTTCCSTGVLQSMSTSQITCAISVRAEKAERARREDIPRLTVSKTLDALFDLAAGGHVTKSVAESGADVWSAVLRSK
jgi:hypothetical protein